MPGATRWPPRQSIPRLANSSRNQALATGPGAIHRRAGSHGLESRLTPSVTRRSTQKPTPMVNLARSCSVFYLRWKRARTECPREHESDQEDWSGPSNDSRRCQLHCCPCPACSQHAHRSQFKIQALSNGREPGGDLLATAVRLSWTARRTRAGDDRPADAGPVRTAVRPPRWQGVIPIQRGTQESRRAAFSLSSSINGRVRLTCAPGSRSTGADRGPACGVVNSPERRDGSMIGRAKAWKRLRAARLLYHIFLITQQRASPYVSG